MAKGPNGQIAKWERDRRAAGGGLEGGTGRPKNAGLYPWSKDRAVAQKAVTFLATLAQMAGFLNVDDVPEFREFR